MQDLKARFASGDLVGEFTGPVRRIVVHDQILQLAGLGEHGLGQQLEVLALVVGRCNHQSPHTDAFSLITAASGLGGHPPHLVARIVQ